MLRMDLENQMKTMQKEIDDLRVSNVDLFRENRELRMKLGMEISLSPVAQGFKSAQEAALKGLLLRLCRLNPKPFELIAATGSLLSQVQGCTEENIPALKVKLAALKSRVAAETKEQYELSL